MMVAQPEQRSSSIETVARQWLRVDRAAAASWLSQSGLPAEQQQQILQNP
jgi:hypothetical protein